MAGWIKLDRGILDWGWYTDSNTMRVFLHLLLTAAFEDVEFKGTVIHRGEVVTSYQNLSKTLGITISQARTSIQHLKLTGEIASTEHPKFSVISVLNYDRYQSESQGESQASRKQVASNLAGKSQHNKNIRNKELKNIYNTRTREGIFQGFKKTAAHNFNSRSDIDYDNVFCNEVEAL